MDANRDESEGASVSAAMAKTTTISTIAVQSGKTRIVIALLHCGNWLQLKILEITPELTKLGATLAEALELQKAHDEVLRQLQNKQNPVEELLRQADQLISTQKPRAEVYAAMAETLGRAWRDINFNLELRKQILDLNVQYHTKASEFFDKIKELEDVCSDTVVPIEIHAVKEFLTTIHDLRRALLESLMAALQAGNCLLGKLKELGAEGTLDSRPDHIRHSINRALSQVQSWLDELHVRRQDVEITFNRRKLQLEQCLALAILAADLRELEETVTNCRNCLANADQLGDSTASAELLQFENRKLLPEAQLLQEKALKITKATEQLLASGCFAGEEATKQAYAVLSLTSDYLTEVQNRSSLLERVIAFFRSAQSAFNKLDQLEIQLTTSTLRSTSPQLAELHSQCSKAIDEITEGPIAEGYNILNVAGMVSSGTEGVRRKVEEMENVKIRLVAMCVAHREENMRINRALENFFDTYSAIEIWLTNIAEAFLQAHQDMGNDSSSAQDFMNLHRKLLTDLQDKGNEINALLLTLPPILEYLDDERRRDVDRKVENLHEKWMNLKIVLENRLDLGRIYVKFHSEADVVNQEIDKLENSIKMKGQDIDDDTLKNLEIKWESLEPLYQSAKNTGLTFISDAKKISEPHLNTKRACVCIETVLDKLAGRQLQVTRNWQTFHTDIVEKREVLVKLEEIMVESTRTTNWVTKLEAQLYPVITTNSSSPLEISAFIDNKLATILPDIKRAQNEVDQKIKTAEVLITKAQVTDEKSLNIKTKLCQLNQKLIEIMTDYQILLHGLISYFKSFSNIDDVTNKVNKELEEIVSTNDANKIKTLIMEHDMSQQVMREMLKLAQNDCNELSQRISKQEPPNAANHDIEKLTHILEMKKMTWEEQSQRKRQALDTQYRFCQFDEDLQNINRSISNLENQNQELKSRYGKSLEEARASSMAYGHFEKTIQDLNTKIENFIRYGEQLMSEQHVHSPTIQRHIHELQDRWNTLKLHIQETRHLIDLSIQYFQLVQEADNWFKEGSRLLVSIARRSTLVKTPQEAENLLTEISTFLKPGEEKQNERIEQIAELAEKIYGPNLSQHLSHVVDENREMIKSFSIIREELDILSKNLIQAEQEKIRLQKEQEEAAAQLAAAKLAAEEARAAAERERIAAEARAEAERARIAAEARAAAERERIAAEARAAAERERIAAEARAAAERERIAAEARAAAERERIAAEARAAAERERIAAEARAAAERERIAAEARAAAERERIAAEAQAAAERERIAAEEAARLLKEEADRKRAEIESKKRVIQFQSASFATEVRPVFSSITQTVLQRSELLESPHFITPLADAVIQEGSRFSFICQVSGIPAPVITWYKDGILIENNPDYQTTFDQGICTLSIDETFSDDSAKYTCKATNAAGIASTSASLSVKEIEPQEELSPPNFTKLLEPACVKENSSFGFHCKVEGNPLPNVQWFKNQDCIDFAPGYNITYNNGDAILKFEKVELKDKSEYTCRATNQLGSAQSTASLSVTPMVPSQSPSIVLPLSNVMGRAGQKIKLECEITGLPIPNIVWYQNGQPVRETRELKLHREGDKATLIIFEAFPKDAGNYRVVATNIAGEAASTCSVSVKGRVPNETSDSEIASDMEPIKPSIQLPLVDVKITDGSRVRLDCVIIGQPEPEVIWYHDNRPVKESADYQLLFQGDRCSLVIQKAVSTDEGEYKVVALNSAGEASSKCQLSVQSMQVSKDDFKSPPDREIPVGYPPRFNKLLSDVLVSEGETVLFEGNVSGQPRPEIKWLLNNLPVILDSHIEANYDNEGNIIMKIIGVKPEDKGVYTVKAINEHGEAKCFSQLIVKSSKIPETVKYEEMKCAPIFIEVFKDRVAFENTPTKFECIASGKPKPKIKWLFRGQPITGNNEILVSTSGDRQVLSIPNLTKATEGTISCIAENEIGSATCTATLTVHPISTVALPEQNELQHHSSISIKREVHTESSSSSSTKVISSSRDVPEPETKIHSFSSHDQRTFKQTNQQAPEISESHSVEEYLKLGNNIPIIHEKSTSSFSTEKSQPEIQTIQHSLLQKPVIKARAPKFMSPVIGKIVDQNTVVVLDGIVDGSPAPAISWTKNGKEIVPSDRVSIKWEFNKASLEIKDTCAQDGGRYTCTAMNEAGTALSTADLVIRKTIFPPVFGRRLQAQVIKKSERIIMEVEVTGTPEPTVTWFKDAIPIQQALSDNYKIKSYGNCHSLIIEKADLKHSGRYMVKAVNSGGEAQSIADIAVFEPTPDTMVEVVKTVVFEDVRKHETLTSAADKISSSTDAKVHPEIIDEPKPIVPISMTIPEAHFSESSFSTTSKSEYSTFSSEQKSQQVTTSRLEYNAPAIGQPNYFREELPKKETDFEIVGVPPAPDLPTETRDTDIDEGIQTSSISKESSLQYFVNKLENVKEKEMKSLPLKLENYKKFEPKPLKIRVEEEIKKPLPKAPMLSSSETQYNKIESMSASKIEFEEQNLKPEPPAMICYSEPTSQIFESKVEDKISTTQQGSSLLPLISDSHTSIQQSDTYTRRNEFSERTQSHETKFSSSSNGSYFESNKQFEKRIDAMSPRPEALQMEKLWVPKHEFDKSITIIETTPDISSSYHSHSVTSKKEIITELPRIHYIANVSHCIEPCEKNIHTLFSRSEMEESKNEFIIEEQNVKPSEMSKSWPPAQKTEIVPSQIPKPYPSMESLTIRPVSVQDITDEVILEPGPPPILDYAQPPTVRKQSYVETVEQELESKIVSAKVPPGGVRTIPPPPPPKTAPPPPLPPKKEQPLAPPIPAKPIKTQVPKKTIVIEPQLIERFPDLQPFPFKPDTVTPKHMKAGPPPTPSKFIKGRFTDSDYESDFESSRIQPKWKPCSSDTEEPAYRKVKAPKVKDIQRSKSTEPEPLPPSKFDQPPIFPGPPRPKVQMAEQKQKISQFAKQTTKEFVKVSHEPKREFLPAMRPGTPPMYIVAPQKKIDTPKHKPKVFVDGYMADTDEPFLQQKASKIESREISSHFERHEYKSENVVESSQKCVSSVPTVRKVFHPKPSTTTISKELTATPIITSLSTEKYEQKYEKENIEKRTLSETKSKISKCPPPPSPSKFVKGEFRESDYESDYDKHIPKIWRPSGQDDTSTYRAIRPILTPTGRQMKQDKTPTPPMEFEEPVKTSGILRPKFEPIDKPKPIVRTGEITTPEAKTIVLKPKAISANEASDITKFIPIRPGTPPELAYAPGPRATQIYCSTTSIPYHNAIQTETSNKVHFKESSERCHRTVSVEQSTKVIKFGEQKKSKIENYAPQYLHPNIRGPPPSSPKKFVRGEFRESDYESDVDNVKIKPKWAPSGSDVEDLHYRPVRPPSVASRSSSVPPTQERVRTPMEFDKYPPYQPSDVTDSSQIRKVESNSLNRYTGSRKIVSERSRSHEPHSSLVEIQPASPPDYGYIPDPKLRSKATTIASHHMDNMTQEFKSRTQKFVKDIMTDVDQQSFTKKSILKNGESKTPQVYREDTRAAQYGTKHIDPDTGLIYFKYDFGYEFGIILPGESKHGGIPVPPKTNLEPPKRTADIEMPVYHETTKKSNQHKESNNYKPKYSNKNIKWEPTSESELSEYETHGKRSTQGSRWEPSSCSPVSLSPSLPSNSPAFNVNFLGSDNHKIADTPPYYPDTPVNSQKVATGQMKAPMFITPLRNIAVVSGQNAKFECIVQSEPPPNIMWSKNGRIIENSNDYQLHFRNGVCRLTITSAYPEDAGTYSCTATNSAGNANTTAILDVPGEIKSAYLK